MQRRLIPASAALTLLLVGPGLAQAQIKHNDFSSVNSTFTPDKSSGMFGQAWNAKMPEVNQSVGGKRLTMGNYDVTTSDLNGKAGPYDWRTRFSQSDLSVPQKKADMGETRQPDMSRLNLQQSNLNDSASYDSWQRPAAGPSKFTDALTVHTGQNNLPPQDFGQQLSLQDLNRFDFRGTRSSDGGLPVEHAGTGSHSLNSAGQLGNSPALFDFSSGKTQSTSTQVRSGGAVAPRVSGSNGSSQFLSSTHENSLPSSPVVMSNNAQPSAEPLPSGTIITAPGTDMPKSMPLDHQPNAVLPMPKNGVIEEPSLGPKQVWVRIK